MENNNKIWLDKKSIEKVEEITCTDYNFNEDGETDLWDVLVDDLLIQYDNLKDEYDSLLERYQDRYYR